MSAGTLTLANNSDVVAGIYTSFTTDLSAGDFIIVTTGGVTYTLPVKTIESDTALTLARNYNGPAVTAGAWTAMPRDTLNRISGQMAADTSYAIRQRVLEIDNWYQLLEVNGEVTIKMADGSSYTGPSWLKLIDIMKTLKIDELIPIAEQIRADAQQVADDKPVIIQAKDDAIAAASAAAASEGNAATSESNAATSASTASTKADEAAESARQAGASNPQLALQKSLNLSDLEDRDEAWTNVRPEGPTPLAADPVDEMDSATMGWVKKFVASVKSVLQSWSVINADATAPANGTLVNGGDVISEYRVGTTSKYVAKLQARAPTGSTVSAAVLTAENKESGMKASLMLETHGLLTNPGNFRVKPVLMSSTFGNGADPGNGLVMVDTAYPAHPTGNNVLGGQVWCRTFMNETLLWQFGMYNETNVGSMTSGVLTMQNLEGAGANVYWRFDNNGNAVALNGSWINSGSSSRIKENFEDIKDPFYTMRKIRACTWTLKTKSNHGRFGIGVLAEGLYEDYPEAKITIGSMELKDGTVEKDVESVQAGDSGVLAAVHHESILQLMDIVKEAISTIAGVTTDEGAKVALEALAERIPAGEPS